MEPRIVYGRVAPGAMSAMQALEQYVAKCGLEPALLDRVKTRASQINGCAYCIDMHTAVALRDYRLCGAPAALAEAPN